MRISSTELFEVKSLVENYKKIRQDLSAYESMLDSMEKGLIQKDAYQIPLIGNRIKESVNFLESERNREKRFYQNLEKNMVRENLTSRPLNTRKVYEKATN